MGAEGSLIAANNKSLFWLPPPFVENIIDVTGAGNAYCGGFIVGLSTFNDVIKAGAYASVSASFAMEQFGALYQRPDFENEAIQRLNQYMKGIRI